MTSCPYCKDSVPETGAVYCPACDAAHHEECWTSNQETCSVYGCDSQPETRLLGCPWCEEVYPRERRICMLCNEPLMKPEEYRSFVDQHAWVELRLEEGTNAALTAGYLRNQGVLARIKRKAPISMFRLQQKVSLWVAEEHIETAERLIRELARDVTYCSSCGHVLYIGEEECSYCEEIT